MFVPVASLLFLAPRQDGGGGVVLGGTGRVATRGPFAGVGGVRVRLLYRCVEVRFQMLDCRVHLNFRFQIVNCI